MIFHQFAQWPIGVQLTVVGGLVGLLAVIGALAGQYGPQLLRDLRDEARELLPSDPTEGPHTIALPAPDAPREETDARVLEGLARFDRRERHDTLLRNVRPVDPKIEQMVRDNFARVRNPTHR